MEMKKSRLIGADGVRALACLMVLAHHASQRLSLGVNFKGMEDFRLFLQTG